MIRITVSTTRTDPVAKDAVSDVIEGAVTKVVDCVTHKTTVHEFGDEFTDGPDNAMSLVLNSLGAEVLADIIIEEVKPPTEPLDFIDHAETT